MGSFSFDGLKKLVTSYPSPPSSPSPESDSVSAAKKEKAPVVKERSSEDQMFINLIRESRKESRPIDVLKTHVAYLISLESPQESASKIDDLALSILFENFNPEEVASKNVERIKHAVKELKLQTAKTPNRFDTFLDKMTRSFSKEEEPLQGPILPSQIPELIFPKAKRIKQSIENPKIPLKIMSEEREIVLGKKNFQNCLVQENQVERDIKGQSIYLIGNKVCTITDLESLKQAILEEVKDPRYTGIIHLLSQALAANELLTSFYAVLNSDGSKRHTSAHTIDGKEQPLTFSVSSTSEGITVSCTQVHDIFNQDLLEIDSKKKKEHLIGNLTLVSSFEFKKEAFGDDLENVKSNLPRPVYKESFVFTPQA